MGVAVVIKLNRRSFSCPARRRSDFGDGVLEVKRSKYRNEIGG